MTDENIRIQITRERFENVISIDDSFHMAELTHSEMYRYICQFVVNENGEYLDEADARKLFKAIPRKEMGDYIAKFFNTLREAFVNPTSGGG